MRWSSRLTSFIAVVLLASPAAAQSRRAERGFLSVNGGAQTAAGAQRDSFTYDAFAESGTIDVEYPGKVATHVDGGAGIRIWRRVGLALFVSRTAASATAKVTARVPHPFYDNQHRSVSGNAEGIDRQETAAHLQVYYDLSLPLPWRVRVSAGPSFFTGRQDVVERVETAEVYPYDQAEFSRATLRQATGSGAGANVAVDAAWMFSRRVGLGAQARYAWGSVSLNAEGARSVSTDTGGLQAGAGLRIHF